VDCDEILFFILLLISISLFCIEFFKAFSTIHNLCTAGYLKIIIGIINNIFLVEVVCRVLEDLKAISLTYYCVKLNIMYDY